MDEKIVYLYPIYWTASTLDWYHRQKKGELKCTIEGASVISMHSKVPAGDPEAAVPPVVAADAAHGFR